jgi:hypothetical protein
MVMFIIPETSHWPSRALVTIGIGIRMYTLTLVNFGNFRRYSLQYVIFVFVCDFSPRPPIRGSLQFPLLRISTLNLDKIATFGDFLRRIELSERFFIIFQFHFGGTNLNAKSNRSMSE